MLYITHYDSPLGRITLGSDGAALTGLWFDGQKYEPDISNSERFDNLQVFIQSKEWLNVYFSGKIPDFLPPLSPQGTAFRRAVWSQLLQIPYGTTVTYGELGKRAIEVTGGNRMSGQAIGGAVGHNPISLMIPCHRVIGADGSLTGYAGGVEKKAALLRLEWLTKAGESSGQ